jgi:hypothetical protein
MTRGSKDRCGGWGRRCVGLVCGLVCGLVWLCLPAQSHAICGLDAAAFDQVREVDDLVSRQAWAQLIARQGGASCVVCHLAGYGPRNRYGTALNMLVTGNDRENSPRKRDAGRVVNDIPADPSLPDSPTFGELIRRGLLPASDLVANRAAIQNLPADPPEEVTVERARELMRQAEDESPFEILQLSRTPDVSPEVATVLAEFRGEMLILGLRSLSPEVARALAKSRAATVWLHSVTAVTPEAAAAIAEVPGDLVLSGLVKLASVPLARKLARRPAALSLPYLREISPEVAAALAETPRGLTLAALTDASAEVQAALAKTAAALSLPSLKSLASLPLTRKLAAGYASSVLLPGIRTLSVEQAEVIAAVERRFFLGGTFLPLSVMSEEVATVFAKNPAAGRLALGAGSISDPAFKILVESPVRIELPDTASLSDEQVRIMAAAVDRVPGGPFGTRSKFSVPMLTTLDSALLAETLLRSADGLFGVTSISPAAAEALGRIPEAAAGKPDVGFNFPSLAELSPETARLVMNRRWSGISLSTLREAAPETVRTIVRQSSNVSLGLTAITPEVAAVFGELASDTVNLGGGTLAFPCLSELSPEAARVLVTALNRGEEVPTFGGLNRSPQLFIGGRGVAGIAPPLTPALARELARYRGRLSIAGLRGELAPEAAAALQAYRGPSIDLAGPAIDRPSPEAAAELAKIPVKLDLPIRVLDSVPLAEKLAGQSSLSLNDLTVLSDEAAQALARHTRELSLNGLTTLSAEAAQALSQHQALGLRLNGLTTLSEEAAKALSQSKGFLSLNGLTMLPDDAAEALAQHRGSLSLNGLTTLSADAAQALGQHQGDLSLAGLTRLSAEAAKALAAADQWSGFLPRVTALDSPDAVAVAEALAVKKGSLNLPGLRRISPKTLTALIQKEDVAIPLIETLELIPEPDGSPTEDFLIPEGFRQR